MQQVANYDPSKVIVTVGGAPISGYADGTFVTVERDEDSFTKQTGADGAVARAKSSNRSGSITLTLQQTSLSNDLLSALNIRDEATGAGVVPVIVKDLSGTTLAFAASGWIKKPARAGFGKALDSREWIIDCAAIDLAVGGNPAI